MRAPAAQLQPLEENEPVTLSSLIRSMVKNYGTFFETREQLLSLQEWVKEQEKVHNGN